MPWKERNPMELRQEFVLARLRGERSMTTLCDEFGVSRKTGYKWLRRYQEEGKKGLVDRSRAPRRKARALSAEVVAAIVEVRRQRPHWGPKKLRWQLERSYPEMRWPAPSTIGEVLRREGLVRPDGRRQRRWPRSELRAPQAPNDVWGIDFKGWFRTRNGERCDPLTVTDLWSRFILQVAILPIRTAEVREEMERLFERYGVPEAIRSDNGAPCAGPGVGGLSRLSVDWVKAGIRLERIEPGKPHQNGSQERLHGTLQRETARPPAATKAEQQERFDRYREDFNERRPHEALGMEVPAKLYRRSTRVYPKPWYDAEHAVRQVKTDGSIMWGGRLIFVSTSLPGEPVGLAETPGGPWVVRFADLDLGLIERGSWKLLRVDRRRRGPGQTIEERGR
ncbi:MAG: transposase [Acidobacteria bacterium]|nr:transposase [Acidobacteriota bacterium]